MQTASQKPGVRRTQEDRSAETRTRVMDAALECLIEHGYASTTTTLIAERAGVSRGAQLHHFPTRQDLFAQAVEHLAYRNLEELRRMTTELTESEKRPDAALELLWQIFSGPLSFAMLELWIAARTDPHLHAAVEKLDRDAGESIRATLHELAGVTGDGARFDRMMDLTVHLLRGMALQRTVHDDIAGRRRLFNLWKNLVIQHE